MLRRKERNPKSAQGAALIMALLISLIITSLAVAYTELTVSQSQEVNTSVKYTTAEEAVMAGYDMARFVLVSRHTDDHTGWSTQLTQSYNNSLTYNANDTPLNVDTSTTGFQWYRKIAYAGGYFYAYITNNSDGGGATTDKDDIVILNVVAQLPTSSQTQVQSLVRYRSPLYAPDSAIVTGGALKMWGASQVDGTGGTIYATGSVDVSGCSKTPAVSQGVYTPGTITASPGQIGGAGPNPGAPAPQVPSINPSLYYDQADFDLKPNGQVYTKTGGAWVLLGTATQTTSVANWYYNATTMTWNNNGEPYSGTVYVQDGNMGLNGNIGGVTKTWTGTLLVMGVTPGNGNVTLAGTANCIMTPDSDSLAILAWGNITGTGNLTVNNGLVAAHEQISIGGNLTVVGSVVAESATLGMYGLAVQQFGSAHVTYNGGLQTILRMGDAYIKVMGFKKLQ